MKLKVALRSLPLLVAVILAGRALLPTATPQTTAEHEGPRKKPRSVSLPATAAPPALTLSQAKSEEPSLPTPEMQAFHHWQQTYLLAEPAKKAALEKDGIRLAQARRPVFKQLIRDDPREAIRLAVPVRIRQQLPQSVLSHLEQRVNERGALRVYQAKPLNPEEPIVPIYRKAELKSGKSYTAHLYGAPQEKTTWTAGAHINGVSIDSDLAVSDLPTREMEPGEKFPAGKTVLSVCPVSGKEVVPPADIPEVLGSIPAAEGADEVFLFCDGSHRSQLNETLTVYAEGGTGGAQTFTGALPSAPTPAIGNVKVLVIPMSFADQNGVPSTEAALYDTLRDVADHYSKASYGRISLTGAVTPPIKLPHNEAWYVNQDTSNGGPIDGEGVEHNHAREQARRLGFDSNDYDCTVVRHSGGPGSYGGLGGGSSVWVRSNGVSLWAHEIGHCFGLAHSNFWDTAGSSSIGAGANQEYGDSYDIMGGAGMTGHYNTQAKSQIRWLPANFTQPVTQSGLYRIYAFDVGALDPLRRYALTIVKDSQRTYWGMVRSLFDTNPWMKNGLELGWRFPNGSGSNFQLIDTTNGSPFGKEDAPISLGSTFSDTEAGIHMTTVAMNDSPRYVDVQINMGSYPANQAPTMTLAASDNVVPLNATVTFTATATDPDGDPLAYAWQHFGSTSIKIVSPNSSVITRQFTTAGSYVVTCTASDMKGGTVTRNQLITVGSATTYTIAGRITLGGVGLSDVVVTANNANGVISDSDGYFVIPNLGANTYALTPLLYGFSFSELFNNSITVGPNFSGANFEAIPASIVTITATDAAADEVSTAQTATFTLTRTGDDSQPLAVNVNSALGTSTKTTDYTLSPDYAAGSQGFSTFTIPAGSSSLTVTLTPVIDTTQEGPETIILQLASGPGYLLGTASSATVVLADDDTALPKISLTATQPRTTEGSATPASFLLTRTGATTADLSVSYAATGTATSGTDYSALSGSVIIPAGSSTATLELVSVDDSSSESLESTVISLTTLATYITDSTARTVTASIYDDDLQSVSVTASDPAAAEVDLTAPSAAANTGTFLVSRSGDTAAALTVYYAFSAVTGSGIMALHGVDYEAMPGSIIIPAGQNSAAITITPRFDSLGEGTEQVVLTLGANATNYVLGSTTSATVSITDNAADLPYVDVINNGSANESGTANFTITVRGGTGTGNLTLPFSFSGTASPTDFSVSGTNNTTTGTVIALNNGATVTRTVTITNIQDTELEDLESLTLSLGASASYQLYPATTSATMWLRDNDNTNTVYVDTHVGTSAATTETVTEGTVSNPTKFYISRTGSTAAALTVNYTVSGTATSGSDYTALSGTVTLAAGALGADVTLSIINDTEAEGTETLIFNLEPGSYSRGTLQATMYLADNEAPTVNVGFTTPTSSGAESSTTVDIPVSLSAAAAAPVTVEYKVASASATGVSNTVSNTPPGYWVRLVKVGSSITQQQSNDGVTWVTRASSTISNLGNNYLAGLAYAPGSTTTAGSAVLDNFTITDLSVGGTATLADTDAAVGTAAAAASIASGTYTFSNLGAGILNASTADNFRYVHTTITGSANCTLTARVVSIGGTASSNNRAGVMLRSTTAAGSVFSSTLVNNSTTTGSAVYGHNRATTNSASTTPTAYASLILPVWTRIIRTGNVFTQSHSRDGVTWTNFATAPVIALGNTVLAGLATTSGTDGTFITSSFDNVTLNGSPVTQLSGYTVGFTNDQGTESYSSGTSTWTVNGTGSSIGSSGDEGYFPAVPVTGDFTLVARVVSMASTVTTGQAGVMVRTDRNGYARQVSTLYNRSGLVIEQRYRLQGVNTAFGTGIDYSLPPGLLTFAPGETSKNISFTVINDTADEPDNLISIQLLNANGAALSTTPAHGYTILDDDLPPSVPFVGFASSSSLTSLEAAGSISIPVALSYPATASGSIDYATADGTALAGTDYTATSGTLSFTAGQSIAYITVPLLDDATLEPTETFTVILSNAVGLQQGSLGSQSVSILDEDSPAVSILASSPLASESGSVGQFTLSRTGPTTADLTVTLTRTGTAANATDYSSISTSQVIPAGMSSLLLPVTAVNDVTNEGTETVILTVATGSGYVIGSPSVATVSLLDNDRSTVTLSASTPATAEGSASPGQFTFTRTAPTTASLSVAFTISGTASNGSDYTSIASTISIPAGQTSVTLNISPINDSTTEGTEDVTLSLGAGSYDIGSPSFDNVTLTDNDFPPTVYVDAPTAQGPLLASTNGIIVSAQIEDDGAPAAVTQTWSCVSGPGTATILTPSAASTGVTFSAPGTYVLRITATDTQFSVSDQVTVLVGSAAVASDWFTQDLGPSSARRGQSLYYQSQATVSGTGTGYAGTADTAHVMVRPITGNGSVVARLTSLSSTTALAGVTLRDSLARSCNRAVLGYVPGTGLQFRIRTTVSTADTVTTVTGLSLPLWLKLERDSGTNAVTASHSSDGSSWTPVGTPTAMTLLNSDAHYGLTTTSNSTSSTATALLDNITLTPAPSGPALYNEDSGVTPNLPGSASYDGTTYTVAGSPTGYFHGWQYAGDFDLRARLVTFPSGAGSASGGIRIAESIESGAYMHLGRMPTSSYSGYYWTNVAGGSSGGVPSGISAGNWMRIVRTGNRLVGYRATHNTGTGGPNAWTQIGQPQTIIMTTPVWVGLYVSNNSGVGLNTCTFTNFSVDPVAKAPIISASASQIFPIALDGSITDDALPAAFTSQWTQYSGPGTLNFGSTTSVDTTATSTICGSYGIRLTATDTSTTSFFDYAFSAWTSPFAQWLDQNSVGDENQLLTESTLDADGDGLMNLLEYAVGTNGTVSNVNPQVVTMAPISSQQFLRISLPKNPAATDVSFIPEASSDMVSWSGAGLIIETQTSTQLIVRDTVPVAPGARRFMRVRVERP